MTGGDLARLVRLPLVITALVDPVAGHFLAGGDTPLPYLGVAAAAAGIYLGGMALNDLFDVAFDRVHHPGRVLPSGRVRPGQALTAGAVFLMAGVAFAGFTAPACGMVALALAMMVLLYDAAVKRVPVLGPAIMGACRGLSLVLGAYGATAGSPPPTSVWIAAGVLAVYVASITSLSRLEEANGSIAPSRVRARLLPGLAVLSAIPLATAGFPLAAAAPLVLLALLFLRDERRNRRRQDRFAIMRRVGAGVRGVLLVDAAVLWGAGGFGLGAGALGLFLIATVAARARST